MKCFVTKVFFPFYIVKLFIKTYQRAHKEKYSKLHELYISQNTGLVQLLERI